MSTPRAAASCGFVGAEVVAQPLDDRAGGDLAALDRVLARDDGVGVGAEDALAVEGLGALAEQQVGRAGDKGHLAGGDDVEADHGDKGVGPAGGDGNAGGQAQLGGDGGEERADDRAHVEDLGRQLGQEVVEADGGVEIGRPAAGVAVVVGADGRRCRCCPPSGR